MKSTRTIQAGEMLSAVRSRALAAPLGGRARTTRGRRRLQAGDAGALPAPAPSAQGLTGDQKHQLVDTLITLLEGLYAHLPLKRARYGTDPVQMLRLLRDRSTLLSDADFHAEMSLIVTGLRDAHTRYRQRSGDLAGKVAMLPFLVESYGPEDAPRYVVSRIGPAKLIGDPAFVQGVELLSWSGIPFDRAVSRWADWETGGRPDARRARALQTLTFRSLQYGPPPDEEWVIVRYQPARGGPREVRIPWRIVTPEVATTSLGSQVAARTRAAAARRRGLSAETCMAQNPAAEAERRAKQLMFAEKVWTASLGAQSPAKETSLRRRKLANGDVEFPSRMPDVLAARQRQTSRGPIGYLRIWSFSVGDDEAFVQEVIRLVEQLPDAGLVIDLRSNPGGLIWAAERALQLFTPRPITPTRFSWLATDVTRAMAAVQPDLTQWAESLQAATSTGEHYSQPLPITDPEACNDIGQRHSGPVVAVVDANTYSAGDLFAAGFVDNRVGPLLCVGKATGAGGANVWGDDLVRQGLSGTRFELTDLPGDVHFTVAVRRATRAGVAEGTPIEDLGIAGQPYAMSRDDLLTGNRDLIERCAEILASQSHTRMQATARSGSLVVTASGVDTIGLFADGRPWESRPASDLPMTFAIPGNPSTIEVVAWAGGEIAQRRRLRP